MHRLSPLTDLFYLLPISLCFLRLPVAEVGFCAAPTTISVSNEDNSTGVLYSKVSNPTLSPVHLQDLPGFTRSVYKRDYALITPESHVFGPLPDWKKTSGAYLITPAMGSHFVMYIANMQENSSSALPPSDVEKFIFVVNGTVTLTNGSGNSHNLVVDSFAYMPPNFQHSIDSDAPAILVVFEQRYSYLNDYVPELTIGSTDE